MMHLSHAVFKVQAHAKHGFEFVLMAFAYSRSDEPKNAFF